MDILVKAGASIVVSNVKQRESNAPSPPFWDNQPAQMVFATYRMASLAKPELILWLWEKIRKTSSACRYTVMFCHGWQNKASRAKDGSLNAGHVTLRKTNTGRHSFSYFRTTEQKLLRLCEGCHSQACDTPFERATHISTNQYLLGNHDSSIVQYNPIIMQEIQIKNKYNIHISWKRKQNYAKKWNKIKQEEQTEWKENGGMTR